MEVFSFVASSQRRRHLRNVMWDCFTLLIGIGFFAMATSAHAATATIVTGSVLDEKGAGYPNAQIEFHTSDGSIFQKFTSGTDGKFTITSETSTISGKFMTVEVRKPSGYAKVNNSPYSFTYQTTDAIRTVTFDLVKSGKTINVTVKTEDGTSVAAADMNCTSSNPTTVGGGSGTGTVQNGTGTVEVTGGTWYCKADKNLSEQDPSRYPWVPVGTAQTVEFADDDTEETADIEFIVAAASTKVSVKPTDKDGDTLVGNDFKGDVTYDCYNGDYGTYVTRNKVGSDGVSNIYLLPGVCTIQAFHQQLEGQSYDPSTTSFVVPEEGSVDIGELQAVENDNTISGTVEIITTEATEGEAAKEITVVATNLDTGTKTTGHSDASGEFLVNNLGPGEYSVAVEQDGIISVLSTLVEVGQGEDITDVAITGAEADTIVAGTVEENGSAVADLAAMVVVEGNGVTFSAAVEADGSYTLEMYTAGLPEEDMTLRLVTQSGAEYFATSDVAVPVVADSTFNQDIAVSSDEATISGSLVETESSTQSITSVSEEVFGDNAKVLAINLEDGSVEETLVESDGSFSLEVSPGEWELYAQIEDPDATALGTLVSDQRIEVAAGETESGVSVPIITTEGTVEGTVTDASGDPVEEAPVLVTNLPALQAQGSYDPQDVISVTTTTDKNGEYTVDVPNGDFTVSFGSNPDVTNLGEPETQEVKVTDGDATADGEYREASGSVEGSLDKNIDSATITFYSEQGGTETVSVQEDGSFDADVASGEWSYIASGVKDGELWTGEGTLTVGDAPTTVEPMLEDTGVAFPGSTSKTADVSETIAVANSDGASVMLPPYATGFEGSVTVELVPDAAIQFNGGIAQVGIAYDVAIRDSEGFLVAQLNRPATIELPINEVFAQGVDPETLTPGNYNENLESYLYNDMVADTDGSSMVIQTTHLSRFAVTTTLDALNAAPGSPTKLKAKKVSATSATLVWKASSGAKKYTIQVRKANVKNKKQWTTMKKVKKTRRVVKHLVAKTKYQFRVKACNAQGCSDFAKWRRFTTR